jgi:Holliday junction resolvase-like predicted endonuclease
MVKEFEVGICGVFHVAAELTRRGWIAMPTIRNTKEIDIIARKADKNVSIQVKTNSYGKIKYPMGKVDAVGDNIFFVFVTLKRENERPDFYVVPSKIVAEYTEEAHQIWKEHKPKMKLKRYEGKSLEEIKEHRKKTAMRQFWSINKDILAKMPEKFRNMKIEDFTNWQILEGL